FRRQPIRRLPAQVFEQDLKISCRNPSDQPGMAAMVIADGFAKSEQTKPITYLIRQKPLPVQRQSGRQLQLDLDRLLQVLGQFESTGGKQQGLHPSIEKDLRHLPRGDGSIHPSLIGIQELCLRVRGWLLVEADRFQMPDHVLKLNDTFVS